MSRMEHERKAIIDVLLSKEYDFPELAVRIFQFQYANNLLYQAFCDNLGRTPRDIIELSDIPFLPIRFFKSHDVTTGDFKPEVIFKSSGTTESGRSKHLVRDLKLYEQVSTSIFEQAYGPLEDFVILALLPSYLEQGDSSLVYMVRSFIETTQNSSSQFYRYDFEKLIKDLDNFLLQPKNIILWGVTYALLDFAEQYTRSGGPELRFANNLILMETGGMKGRREELLRSEVHHMLNSALHVGGVHSEYGMTEMLSQAYSTSKGVFQMGQTLKTLSYDVMDPLTYIGDGISGRCHVVDLANIDSCSFLATDDICRTQGNSFEVLGRLDHSDIRGCSLLYS